MRHSRTVLLMLVVLAPGILCRAAAARPQTAPAAPVAQSAGNMAAEAHLSKGYDALKQDQYNHAADEFRAALALDPKLVLRARFPLAVALFEMHKSDAARREFEEVRRVVGDHPNVMYYLGRLDLENHNFEQAVGHFSKAAAKPPFPDTAYYLGYAYFKAGNLAAGEEWLKKAEIATPRDERVPYQLGFLYRQKGLKEEAEKAFAGSEQLRQRNAEETRLQADCAQKLEQGPRPQAHAVCDQLYDNNDADRLTELGTLYGQHGDYEAALKPLRRAAELAPHSPQMQYNLALTYYQLSRFQEARAPLQNALQRWPDLFQLNALYGAVLWKLGEDASAYDALRHAHELEPRDSGTTDLLYTVSLALAGKDQAAGHYSDSLHYCLEASNLKPNEPEPHRRMAALYLLTGQRKRAEAEKQAAERAVRSTATQNTDKQR